MRYSRTHEVDQQEKKFGDRRSTIGIKLKNKDSFTQFADWKIEPIKLITMVVAIGEEEFSDAIYLHSKMNFDQLLRNGTK